MDKPASHLKSMRNALETTVSKEACSAEGTRRLLRGEAQAGPVPAPVAPPDVVPSAEAAPTPSLADDAAPSAVQPRSRTGASRSLEEIIARLAGAEPDL